MTQSKHNHPGRRDAPDVNPWPSWHARICRALGINPDMPLVSQPLRKPWFLIPIRGELEIGEAEDLVTSVRTYLLSGGPYRKEIRLRLLSLSPESSLAFLYVMRYVAFREAASHFYWPAFRKVLFHDELSYEDVALGMAEATSTLWLKLYRASDAALYFPREGPRHIKWPLAHAGLLRDDKQILRQFALEMLSVDPEIYNLVLAGELDELLLILQEWLGSRDDLAHSRLGKLLLGKSRERLVIAELCRQRLRTSNDEYRAYVADASEPSLRARSPARRQIVYRDRENQVGIDLIVGKQEGNRNISVTLGEKTHDIATKYLREEDATVSLPIFIPNLQSKWLSSAEIRVGNEITTIKMPTVEGKSSVVFRPDNGAETTRWNPGESYYLLIRAANFSRRAAETLFREWSNLDEPEGDWHEFRFLWVETRGLVAGGSDIRRHDSSTEILEQMEEAADKLGVPSFGHQIRPSIRLLGAMHELNLDTRYPAYSAIDPPLAEIGGLWSRDIRVLLQLRHKLSGKYVDLESIVVPSSMSGELPVVRILEPKAEPGHYKLSIDDESLDFQVRSLRGEIRQLNGFTTELSIHFRDQGGNEFAEVNRFELEELDLWIRAWRYADLTLALRIADTARRMTIPIQTDENGEWLRRIDEIPVAPSSFPSGDLMFVAEWKGLFGARATALDDAHISGLEVKVESDSSRTREWQLDIGGSLKTREVEQRFIGMVFAEIPWSVAPVSFELNLENNGRFQGKTKSSWRPGWLAFFRKADRESKALEAIRLIEVDAGSPKTPSAPPLSERSLENLMDWGELSEEISKINLPPRFEPLLGNATGARVLADLAGLINESSSWSFASTFSDLEAMVSLLSPRGSLAVFRRSPPTRMNARPVLGDIRLTAVKRSPRGHYFAYLRSGQVARGPIDCELKPRSPIDDTLHLVSHDNLVSCVECSLVVPARLFDHHNSPFAGLMTCRRIFNVDRILEPGTSFPVVVGELESRRDRIAELIRVLRLVQSSGKISSHQFSQLVKELRDFVPSEADPGTWLAELVSTLDSAVKFIRGRSGETADLRALSISLEKLAQPISYILDHIGRNILDESL